MQLYHHYYGAWKNCFLDYDYLHIIEGKPELSIRFTRYGDERIDIAETMAPKCEIWHISGFNADEERNIKEFLANNLESVMAEAESTLDGDAELETITFEIEDEIWREFAERCYLCGISPEVGVVRALERQIKELDPNQGETG